MVSSNVIASSCARRSAAGRLNVVAPSKQAVELRGLPAARLASFRNLTVYPSDANFILVRTPDANAAFHALLERGVLVKNPGLLHNCLRITVGTAAENERCVAALGAALCL